MSTGTAATNADTAVRPFHVDIPQEAVDDLRRRITAWRPPEREPVHDQSQGVQLATVHDLADYWAAEYDWRRCEAKLNALPQFLTTIDGLDVHFIHVSFAQMVPAEILGHIRNGDPAPAGLSDAEKQAYEQRPSRCSPRNTSRHPAAGPRRPTTT